MIMERVRDMIRSWNYSEFMILKMWLDSKEQNEIKKYIDKNMLGKTYKITTRVTNETFYCSSLVWWAHRYSWKKIDLDSDWWFIVDPADLIFSSYVKSKKHIKY